MKHIKCLQICRVYKVILAVEAGIEDPIQSSCPHLIAIFLPFTQTTRRKKDQDALLNLQSLEQLLYRKLPLVESNDRV